MQTLMSFSLSVFQVAATLSHIDYPKPIQIPEPSSSTEQAKGQSVFVWMRVHVVLEKVLVA